MISSSAISATSKLARNLDMYGSSSGFQTKDIDARDYDHQTALHFAVGEGHIEVIELLCTKCANPNIKNRCDNCPLDYAKHCNFEGFEKALEKYGTKLGKGENIDEFH
eukprot:15366190-Ditylum_brightwellii.AAC.1